MRSAGWGGLKLVRRGVAPSISSGKPRLGAALALLLSATLPACEASRSFERTADGSIVHSMSLVRGRKPRLAKAIVERLSRGLDVYDLQIGDELEILFRSRTARPQRAYLISVADKLAHRHPQPDRYQS